MTGDWAGVGGPNIAPPGDGDIADCIANAPGGPVHVLVSDREAEHIPGCNMAFRRDALAAVGGFDARYRTAGDDVDLCWRLQAHGGRIGFHAGAMDWHHRRNSISMYWRQQKGYGKAEALLEEKWPERYNGAGHLAWCGRLYGRGFTLPVPFAPARVYGGVWGTAAYQSLYAPASLTLAALPLMPEWYFVIAALAGLALLGLSWPPLAAALPLALLAVLAPLAQAALAAARATYPQPARSRADGARRRALTAFLHLVQPLARLIGRVQHGLTPWRRAPGDWIAPRAFERNAWRERWRAPEHWLGDLETRLRNAGVPVRPGGDYDRWDLETRRGLIGGARVRLAIEEHGGGRQLARWRAWPRPSLAALATAAALGGLASLAALDRAWVAAALLALACAMLAGRIARDCGGALASVELALAEAER
jgi:O-antigen biosynthesis protein